jgi:AbrB family looped-hinge helix DNA binding protein
MDLSTVTSNYQITLPKKVRDILELNPDDTVTFHIVNNCTVIIKKHKILDKAYEQALAYTLSEWES